MQIVSNGDNLHEMSSFFLGKTRKISFLFFPEKQDLMFMQIVFNGDNLHEMSNPIFREK